MMVDANSGTILLRWFDNRAVTFVSSYASLEPSSKLKRWSRNEKKSVDITCPFVVKEYNKFMGGVDVMDMLLSLYRIDRKSTKWYMRLVYHLLGITVNNSWLLSRRNQDSAKMSLREFIIEMAFGCINARKPRKLSSNRTVVSDVRYDGFDHLPKHQRKRLRCKKTDCHGTSVWACDKCNVTLCLSERSNCFASYHTRRR